MITSEAVRAQLREVCAELAKLDERREVLLTLLRGYEAWLRVFDATSRPPKRRAPSPTTTGAEEGA